MERLIFSSTKRVQEIIPSCIFFIFLFFASIDPDCLYRYGASILAGKEEETDSLKIKLMHFYSPLWRLFCLDVGRNKGNRNVLLLPR